MRNKSLFVLSMIFAIALSTAVFNNGKASAGSAPALNPREEATAAFNFDGLMALCFGNPQRVSVGLLDVHHHTPEFSITKIKDGVKTKVVVLKGEELRGTLYVGKEGGASGVSRYYSDQANDLNDFRWTIDFESDVHQRRLYIKEDKLFGKIHFNSGLFYAENLTEMPVRFFAADDSGKMLPFNRKIAQPAAKINLAEGETLVIKGAKETIRLTAESGVRYEAIVHNLPPPDMANSDHWLFYYDVVGAKVTRYMAVTARKAAYSPRPLMCEAAVFSKSRLN